MSPEVQGPLRSKYHKGGGLVSLMEPQRPFLPRPIKAWGKDGHADFVCPLRLLSRQPAPRIHLGARRGWMASGRDEGAQGKKSSSKEGH